MRRVELVIPVDVNDGSPNLRLHWRVRHQLDRRWQESAWGEWASIGCPRFPGKVRVSFICYRVRVIDHCNVHGSRVLKAIIDGIKGHCFAGDDPKHLEWGEVRLVTGKEHPCPTVIVTIEEVEAPESG